MSLININHFFDQFNIGQKSQATVSDKILRYIDMYEPEYLEGVMGADFSALFNAGILEPRFEELKDKLIAKPSPIAAYVFFNLQQDESVAATGIGDLKATSENGTRVSEIFRRVEAWNIMVDKSRKFIKWLEEKKDIYPEFDVCKVDGSFFIKTNSFGL